MPVQNTPDSLNVPMGALATLAVEWWRLNGAVSSSGSGAARHALRKIEDFLRDRQLEVQSLDGRLFDPGLAARVIDVMDDPALPAGEVIVAQTISPLVFWQGQVIKPAEVITRRGTARPGR